MNVIQLFRFTLIASLMLNFARDSKADLIYEVVFDQPIYYTSPGQLVTVNVLLRETATNNETLRLSQAGANLDGLFTIGFTLNHGNSTSGNGATIPDGNPSDRVTLNPAFNDAGVNERSNSASLLRIFAATTDSTNGIEVPVFGNTAELLIASIQFSSSGVLGDLTTLQLGDLDSGANTVFVDSFTPDDFGLLQFGSASIASVPEPSSIVLVTIGVAVGISRGRKRGEKKYF
jgi:hypothetical protein